MILIVRLSTMWDVSSVGKRPLAQILLPPPDVCLTLDKDTNSEEITDNAHTHACTHTPIKACVQYSISHNLWSSVSSVKVYCGHIQLIKHLGQHVTVSHLKDF